MTCDDKFDKLINDNDKCYLSCDSSGESFKIQSTLVRLHRVFIKWIDHIYTMHSWKFSSIPIHQISYIKCKLLKFSQIFKNSII